MDALLHNVIEPGLSVFVWMIGVIYLAKLAIGPNRQGVLDAFRK